MRNVRKKRAQDKQNYLQNKERQASLKNYRKNADKDTIMHINMPYAPNTTLPTVFHSTPMHTTNKYKA